MLVLGHDSSPFTVSWTPETAGRLAVARRAYDRSFTEGIVTYRLLVAVGLAISIAALAAGCSASTAAPTAADAKAFLDNVDATFTRLSIEANRAGWVAQNFITDDTEALDARMTQAIVDAVARFAKESVRFDNVEVPGRPAPPAEPAQAVARAGDAVRSRRKPRR